MTAVFPIDRDVMAAQVATYDDERRFFDALLKNTLRVKADAGDVYHDHWRNFQLWRLCTLLEVYIDQVRELAVLPASPPAKKKKSKSAASAE